MTVYGEATVDVEAVARADMAEMERDIAEAKTKHNLEMVRFATGLCSSCHRLTLSGNHDIASQDKHRQRLQYVGGLGGKHPSRCHATGSSSKKDALLDPRIR